MLCPVLPPVRVDVPPGGVRAMAGGRVPHRSYWHHVPLDHLRRGSDTYTNSSLPPTTEWIAVLRIRIHPIHMFLGLLDPDPEPLVIGMDPNPDRDPSIIKQK